MPPNFAIEATCLLDRMSTGITTYTANLVRELNTLAGPEPRYTVTQIYRASRWRRRAELPRGAALRRQLWQQSWWPPAKPYAAVHCTDHRLPDWPVPKVVTIHDVYAALGINFDGGQRDKQVAIYRDFARRADRIVFVSAHSRADFLRLFEYDPARTRVIHLGVNPVFHPRPATELSGLRARLGLSEPYLLFLGVNNPNKNLARLLEAYRRSAACTTHQLVLAGPMRPDNASTLQERIGALGIGARVRLAGRIAADDVPGLYAGAAALLLPSVYEGFGLPILEGMASGIPVLTSTAASCPEVAAGHAELADPMSVDAIAQGIDAVLRRTPAQGAAARDYALGKTWRRTAEQTLEVYRELG